MTSAAVHASLKHLVSGQDRNKGAIADAIDAVVSAHQHGGKDAFDARITDLRSAVDATFLTMDAIHDTARTAVGLPAEPKADPVAQGEEQSAEQVAASRGNRRATRTGVPEGE